MPNTFLILRSPTNNAPKGDGVNAHLVVAANEAAAITAAKAVSEGDIEASWSGAEVIDLGDGGFAAGAIALNVVKPITAFA